jgi:integrase
VVYPPTPSESVSMAKLTDARIRTLKPTTLDRWVGDGQGLWLRVRTSGSKVFVLRKKHAGRVRVLTLGEWPDYALANARARAAAEAVLTRARRRGEAPPPAATTGTVAQLAKEFYESRIAKRYRRAKNARVYRDRLILELGTTKLRAVTHSQLAAIVKAYAKDAPVAANRFLAFTKQVFRFAIASGYLDRSPAAELDRSIAGGEERTRARVLTDDEIRALWHAPGRYTPLLRFLLGTLARIGEAQRATWSHVKLTRWEIPAAHAKNRRVHWVHLSPQILQVVWDLPRNRDLVFDETSPTAVQAWVRRFCERQQISPAFTPHDLRRTGATRLGELGVAPHVVAKMLNHTLSVSDALGVYFRAELEPERVEAFNRWGMELERIVSQAKTPESTAETLEERRTHVKDAE